MKSSPGFSFYLRKSLRGMGLFSVAAALVWTGTAGFAQNADMDAGADAGASAFLQHCMRCHGGILTGNDLQNTTLSTPENLEGTVRRMKAQYTLPLTEKQVGDLVELLQDKEVKFRLEEAELEQEEAVAAPASADGGTVVPIAQDVYARLFVRSCAGCHTVGGSGSSGGDLMQTKTWAEPRLRQAVSSMQSRVGPLTKDQIDGLTQLLKADDRDPRLAAAGYKAPGAKAGSAGARPGTSGATASAGLTMAGASTTGSATTPSEAVEQKRRSYAYARAQAIAALQGKSAAPPEKQTPPMLLLLSIVAVAAVAGFGLFKYSDQK